MLFNQTMVLFTKLALPQSLFFTLISLLSSANAAPPSPVNTPSKCSFNGQDYEKGATWYRHLTSSSPTFCVHCLCKADGRVNCSTVNCSKQICESSSEDKCCKSCWDPNEAASGEPLLTTENSPTHCQHNGRTYREGETFYSNTSMSLLARQPNHCIECLCQAGLVLCSIKTCRIVCRDPTTSHADCCSSCQNDTLPFIWGKSPVSIVLPVENNREGDCTTAGTTYSHGSTWHPLIGPFGPMDCVICKCQNGRIECNRVDCPSLKRRNCSRQLQPPGQCCPICLEAESDSPSDGNARSGILPFMPHLTDEQQADRKEITQRSDTDLQDCIPQHTNTVVYRSHATSSTSGYYQYAFQTVGRNKNTRLLTWTIKDGRIRDFSEQHLSRDEFNILTKTFRFKLQGATRTKFMEKFTRKSKRLPERCDNRCTMKIRRLEEVLHLRDIVKRTQCTAEETAFY